MKVFVYFNLHKKTWSIKAMEGEKKGLVIAHRNKLALALAEFKVSEAGRQRVLREKRKNVHAGVVGEWFDTTMDIEHIDGFEPVSYNPYKAGHFVNRNTDSKIESSNCVVFNNRQVMAL